MPIHCRRFKWTDKDINTNQCFSYQNRINTSFPFNARRNYNIWSESVFEAELDLGGVWDLSPPKDSWFRQRFYIRSMTNWPRFSERFAVPNGGKICWSLRLLQGGFVRNQFAKEHQISKSGVQIEFAILFTSLRRRFEVLKAQRNPGLSKFPLNKEKQQQCERQDFKNKLLFRLWSKFGSCEFAPRKMETRFESAIK